MGQLGDNQMNDVVRLHYVVRSSVTKAVKVLDSYI